MKKNIGKSDRFIRLVLAAVLAGVVAADLVTGTLSLIAIIAAVILLATALFNFCPLYRLLGIQTCPVETKA